MAPLIVLETQRLALRTADEGDAAFILALLNSPGFIANIGDRGVRTEVEAASYVRERVLASYRDHGFGMWVVVETKTSDLIGLAGLVKRDGLDMPDVGYAFLPGAWGQGYAQEAAAAVVRHARERLGLGRLAAITTSENHASMAVLRKVGFAFQGMIQLPGVEGESTYFTID
jgi:[ribosomal protein S5]-alanine N-acetyltransferase